MKMEEQNSAAIARMEEQIKNLDRRMENLEKLTETVNSLALSIERLTASMKTTEETVDTLTGQVSELKEKPAKRWDTVIGAMIAGIIGAIIGFFIK